MNVTFEEIQKLFLDALEIQGMERQMDFVAKQCAGRPQLHRELQNMLRAHHKEDCFLQRENGMEGPHDALGQTIGPYEICEQIGEGGMGVVYAAKQTNPVRRMVALKIIRPGMATEEVVSRFEVERQALAMMDHPNIARVFDGGVTDSGQPYFAMEFVRGVPITEFCDQYKLPIRRRLQLFIEVCHAIHHAHQKGIIHRDVKPSNVLVTLHDDKPLVKVIDFGVAKAVDQQLAQQTMVTRLHQMLGTPAYMSPEQAELHPLGIDTRSDIYSLGVLLYALLTGTTPIDKKVLESASFDEVRRIIREGEPSRPSTRVQLLDAAIATTVAQQRSTAVETLVQHLRGELDWVVIKCLEKDRSRRYETATTLTDDIERYLADLPVLARPPSRIYYFRKFVRRNRILVAAVVLVMASMAAATILSAFFAISAIRSEQRANQTLKEKTREQEGNEILIGLLSDAFATPQVMSSFGNQRTVPELLDDFSQRLDKELRDFPEVEIKLRTIFAGNLTGRGEVARAQNELERVLDLSRKVYGPRDVKVAEVLIALAYQFERNLSLSHYSPTQSYAKEALSIYEAEGKTGLEMAQALYAVSWPIRYDATRQAARETLLQHALQAAQKAGNGVDSTGELYALWDLAACINEQRDGRSEQAIQYVDEALAMSKRLEESDTLNRYGEPRHALTYRLMVMKGDCFHFAGKLDVATDLYQAAWWSYQESGLVQNYADQRAALRFAEACFAQHRHYDAKVMLDEAEQKCREQGWHDHLARALLLRGWGELLREDYAMADTYFRDVVQIEDQHSTYVHDTALQARFYLALSQDEQLKTDTARMLWRDLLPQLEEEAKTLPKRTGSPYTNQDAPYRYARALLGAGGVDNAKKAIDLAERCLVNADLARQWGHAPQFLLLKAKGLIALSRFEEAREVLYDGLARYDQQVYTSHPFVHRDVPTTRRQLECALMSFLQHQEDFPGAEQVLWNSVELRVNRQPESPSPGDFLPIALAEVRLGQFLRERTDFQSAEGHLKTAWNRLENNREAAEVNRRVAAEQLAALYTEWGRDEEATSWKQKLAGEHESDVRVLQKQPETAANTKN